MDQTLEAFPDDGEWECFHRMLATDQEHDQTSLLFGENDGNFGVQSMFGSHNNYNSQESNHSTLAHTNYHFDCNDQVANNSYQTENFDHTKQLKLKRMLGEPELEVNVEDKIISCENPKKKPRALKNVQSCMKNVESKKSQKFDKNGKKAEETYASVDGHSSSGYISEEHNMNEENSGVASSDSNLNVTLNSNGKRRASRRSATDPQSLYARKRRERINERLRTLQNLVPNGTKVDISTMLEDAIHYVKFLQLQIKLLSSDDLWMYPQLLIMDLTLDSISTRRFLHHQMKLVYE